MKILIIAHEDEIRLIEKTLVRQAFVVDHVFYSDGVHHAALKTYDAIIIDADGCEGEVAEYVEQIRSYKKHIPIIIISKKKSVRHKVMLLSTCDEYLVKPLALTELVARVRAILRRGKHCYSEVLESGGLRVDLQAVRATHHGTELKLRNKEFALLAFLLKHKGQVVSREKILQHVWSREAVQATNTVDVHIRYLRQKLNQTYKNSYIQTIPKRGYKFQA